MGMFQRWISKLFTRKPVQLNFPEIDPMPEKNDSATFYPLYWENTSEPHPERKSWSNLLSSLIDQNLEVYNKALDIKDLYLRYGELERKEKIKVIAEFWVALCYFECGFNPGSYSVDVGTKDDRGSWSCGLFQMSANDSSAQKFHASFETLKDPLVNIQVAHEQMMRQIKKTGRIFLPNENPNRYWATILIGNRYSQIKEIRERVIKHATFF